MSINLPGLTANLSSGLTDSGDVSNRTSSGNVNFGGGFNPFGHGALSGDTWKMAAISLGIVAIGCIAFYFYKHRRR